MCVSSVNNRSTGNWMYIILPWIIFSCTFNKPNQREKRVEEKGNYCLYLGKLVKELTLKLKPVTIDTLPLRTYIGTIGGIMLVLKNGELIEVYPQFKKNDLLYEQLKSGKVDYRILDSLPIRKIIYSSKEEIVEECGE